eukprot:COSAG02_NODE_2085_length_9885_cov_9.743946_1_plen_130_part_00
MNGISENSRKKSFQFPREIMQEFDSSQNYTEFQWTIHRIGPVGTLEVRNQPLDSMESSETSQLIRELVQHPESAHTVMRSVHLCIAWPVEVLRPPSSRTSENADSRLQSGTLRVSRTAQEHTDHTTDLR